MKRIACLTLSLLLALLTAGCLNARSLDRYGYVLGVGFDTGEELPYRVSLMLQNTQSDSDSQTNSGFTLVEADCRTLFEAIETLSAGLPFQLNFARTELIVLSADLLTEDGPDNPLSELRVTRLKIRSNACVFVSLSSAKDVLEGMKNELDPNLSRLQQNFVTYSETTGLIPVTNLMDLTEAELSKRYGAVAPLCGAAGEEGPKMANSDSVGNVTYPYLGGRLLMKSGMKTDLAGAALLSKGRMCGLLSGQNVQLLLMATGEFRQGRVRFDQNGKETVVTLTAHEPPKVDFVLGASPRALVTIPLSAAIEQQGGLAEEGAAAWMERYLSEHTEQVFLCCRGLGVDAFRFGREAAGTFLLARDWENCDWEAAYANMEAQFQYDISLLEDAGGLTAE